MTTQTEHDHRQVVVTVAAAAVNLKALTEFLASDSDARRALRLAPHTQAQAGRSFPLDCHSQFG
eukprot:1261346-Rhodomonas_salina.5